MNKIVLLRFAYPILAYILSLFLKLMKFNIFPLFFSDFLFKRKDKSEVCVVFSFYLSKCH